ncbi:PE family protein [Mycobacterium shinjukuense]|uniref:PE family protein n=1 Tax=Mycobacterium shinjukuense TaxID=398694 RepID=UPI0023DEBDEF|nr:PE family protein [Mycobacterium shinjukuense]MCV6984126.1 PE family protein [Mycobacterium shinjukuense]
MAFVITLPEFLVAGATELAGIRSAIDSANVAAAAYTTNVVAAAEDEVSAAIAALLSAHAQDYQVISAQVGLFHDHFVQTLSNAGASYVATEAANAAHHLIDVVHNPSQALANAQQHLLTGVHDAEQNVLHVVNAPTEALLGLTWSTTLARHWPTPNNTCSPGFTTPNRMCSTWSTPRPRPCWGAR